MRAAWRWRRARVRVSAAAGRNGEERLPDARGGGHGSGRSSRGRPRGSLRHVRGVPLQDPGNAQGAPCRPDHAGERCCVRLVLRSGQFDTVRQELLETGLDDLRRGCFIGGLGNFQVARQSWP